MNRVMQICWLIVGISYSFIPAGCAKKPEVSKSDPLSEGGIDPQVTQPQKSNIGTEVKGSSENAAPKEQHLGNASDLTKPLFSEAEVTSLSQLSINNGSLQVFQKTLYPLLSGEGKYLAPNGQEKSATCQMCHGSMIAPFFSNSVPLQAFDALVGTGKVDLAQPKKSRVYLKVAEDGHNCWSDCKSDGDHILSAITDWSKLEAANSKSAGLVSPERAVNEAIEDLRTVDDDPQTVAKEAEDAVLSGAMAFGEDPNTLGGKFIYVPNGQTIPVQADVNGAADQAIWSLDLKESGMYTLWVRARAPTDEDRTFFYRLNNGNFQTWRLPKTETKYLWNQANIDNNMTPLGAINLAAGIQRLEIRRRDDGAMIDAVALSKDRGFGGVEAIRTRKVKVLTFDLSRVCKTERASLTIEISDYNGEAYRVAAPTLFSGGAALRIRGLDIRINGSRNLQYATYRLLEQTIPAGKEERLSKSALVILKESDKDTLSVELAECVIVK